MVEVCWLRFRKMQLFIPPAERVPFNAIMIFFFFAEHTVLWKAHVHLHYRHRAVEQGGSLCPRAEQRRQLHRYVGEVLCVAGVGGILGIDFTGVRRTPPVPTVRP